MKKYFKDISDGIVTVWQGMALTIKHLKNARRRRTPDGVQSSRYFTQEAGIVTLQYPFEAIPTPDNGRYKLHNEIDDCIVCDKCAVVCPVNCIEIETIKSPVPIGETSDGSVKRLYAGKFNIDMAKCCFCGLCTTVCPTECLTMTNQYDFSEFDVRKMDYHFANLSAEEAEEKKRLYEQFVKEKEEAKKAANPIATPAPAAETPKASAPKPAFKPVIKPQAATPAGAQPEENKVVAPQNEISDEVVPAKPAAAKPVVKPVMKPKVEITAQEDSETSPVNEAVPAAETPKPAAPKPVMKPVIKPVAAPEQNAQPAEEGAKAEAPKPTAPKPVMKPVMKKTNPPADPQ